MSSSLLWAPNFSHCPSHHQLWSWNEPCLRTGLGPVGREQHLSGKVLAPADLGTCRRRSHEPTGLRRAGGQQGMRIPKTGLGHRCSQEG